MKLDQVEKALLRAEGLRLAAKETQQLLEAIEAARVHFSFAETQIGQTHREINRRVNWLISELDELKDDLKAMR